MAKRKDNIIWISPPLLNAVFLFLRAVCVGCLRRIGSRFLRKPRAYFLIMYK